MSIFAWYISNNVYQRQYFNDIFIVPLLHNLPNAYFRLISYPVVILTFLILGKIFVEIFHKLLLQKSTQEYKHLLLLLFFSF